MNWRGIPEPEFRAQLRLSGGRAIVGFKEAESARGVGLRGEVLASAQTVAEMRALLTAVGIRIEKLLWCFRVSCGSSTGVEAPGQVQVVGPWEIFNKLTTPFLTIGRWFNRVGRTSGWTRGQVTRTCFDYAEPGYVLLCQWEANIWSEPGDSGSPIFLDADQHPPVDITYIHRVK